MWEGNVTDLLFSFFFGLNFNFCILFQRIANKNHVIIKIFFFVYFAKLHRVYQFTHCEWTINCLI